MKNKKDFKWEVRQISEEKWGVFLMQKFCRTDEPVCYGATKSKDSAQSTVDRMNDPKYWSYDEEQS